MGIYQGGLAIPWSIFLRNGSRLYVQPNCLVYTPTPMRVNVILWFSKHLTKDSKSTTYNVRCSLILQWGEGSDGGNEIYISLA